MPCIGCGKKKMEVEGKFKMRFIGRPDGKLIKFAPGNYEHNKIYMMPYSHKNFKHWELVEKEPELEIPDLDEEDSVFEDFGYIPADEGEEDDKDVAILESMEDYMRRLASDDPINYVPPPKEPIEEKPYRSRDELKRILDEAEVEYNNRSRTETLAKLVERLESQGDS